MKRRSSNTNLQSKECLGGKEDVTPYALGTDIRQSASFPDPGGRELKGGGFNKKFHPPFNFLPSREERE